MNQVYHLSMNKMIKTKVYKKGERPAFYADAKLMKILKKAGDALRAEESRLNKSECNAC